LRFAGLLEFGEKFRIEDSLKRGILIRRPFIEQIKRTVFEVRRD
jgi:hypothetical protein